MMATDNQSPTDVAQFVDEQRLWQRHMMMAEIGATANGGLDRQALTPEDVEARCLLAQWATELGFSCEMDTIGNMFIHRPGTDPDAAPVMSGSHLDTQPAGGRFDGIFGVLAALEVLQAIDQAGIETRRPIEAVNWTNEEGARFQPAVMGSSAFITPELLDQYLGARDARSVDLEHELVAARTTLQHLPTRSLGAEVAAFVEAHIEQGTVLEKNDKVAGVVTGIQGVRRFVVKVFGESGHAGTTPHEGRKDAVKCSCTMINALAEILYDPHDLVRFTVGRLLVEPNSPGSIPGRAEFTVDFRHPDRVTLDRLGDQIADACQIHSDPCTASVEEVLRKESVNLDAAYVPEIIRKSAQTLDIPWMNIYSPAIHDALNLAQICPTGMIFVPCENGISHDEAENVEPSDLAGGTKVLAAVLTELANM